MQISRLFKIVYLLMNHQTITAKVLAERFEVSTRTIYRDIDQLSASGIPIYTNKGKGGGICLMDHFVINKSVLTASEQQDILVGLQSLMALQPSAPSSALSKLSALFNTEAGNWIDVDLSDWTGQLKYHFEQLKTAVIEKRIVIFDYYSASGGSTSLSDTQQRVQRQVEPLQLWFKHRSWYLKAFCLDRQDYRLFKLSRIDRLLVTDANFVRSLDLNYHFETTPTEKDKEVTIKLLMDASLRFRIYDEFEPSQIEFQTDGRYLVTLSYFENEWVYSFIASFGPFVEVLEPSHIRSLIHQRFIEAAARYE